MSCLDGDEQIVAAGDEVHGGHLRVVADALRHPVESLIPLGGHPHFDEGVDFLRPCPVPVNECMIGRR